MPLAPIWVIVLPIAANTGRQRSRIAASPPTMMDKVPAIAPPSPPLTGASSMWACFSLRRVAIIRVACGEMVLISMTTASGRILSITPFSPRMTLSTSGVSETIVITTGLFPATSLGVFAVLAPSAARRSAFAVVRLYTVTSNPAFIKLRAIGIPMMPRPINPTFFSIISCPSRLFTRHFSYFISFVRKMHTWAACCSICFR